MRVPGGKHERGCALLAASCMCPQQAAHAKPLTMHKQDHGQVKGRGQACEVLRQAGGCVRQRRQGEVAGQLLAVPRGDHDCAQGGGVGGGVTSRLPASCRANAKAARGDKLALLATSFAAAGIGLGNTCTWVHPAQLVLLQVRAALKQEGGGSLAAPVHIERLQRQPMCHLVCHSSHAVPAARKCTRRPAAQQ